MEKTPGNVFAFGEVLDLWPEARLILVQRDGRDCVASLLGRPRHSPFRAVSRWAAAAHAGAGWTGHEQVHVVRYESLVTDPAATLEAVCAFLDEPYMQTLIEVAEGRAGRRPDADDNDRRHDSWQASAQGAISDRSIGRHRDGDHELISRLIAGVRISRAARSVDPRSTTVPISGTRLQHHLGYDDAPPSGPRPTISEVAASAKEMAEFTLRQTRRFRRRPLLPTRLTRSSQDGEERS
jgi:hypothetical protein